MSLHFAATVGNLLLLCCLMHKRRSFPYLFWAQLVSVALMAVQNYGYYFHFNARIWTAFDVANIAVEIVYLFDLGRYQVLFWTFVLLNMESVYEYIQDEAGFKHLANYLLQFRVWIDCFCMYALSWVVYSFSQEEDHARPEETNHTTCPEAQTEAQAG